MFTAVSAALVAGLAPAAPALAVGPSPGVVFGGEGAAWQAHSQRFVATPHGRTTTVSELRREGGPVMRSESISGRFGIPAVTYFDGSVERVPAASRTLVLATNPRSQFPRHTRLTVVSTRGLHVLRRIGLHGAFAFDALSPDGMTIYLIQHTSARSITRYVVRAYDLRRGRLVPGVIADRSTGEWKMDGLPVTRSYDGDWAYTLYQGGEDGAFVHALDTRTATAHCIDLPHLRVPDMSGVRLRAVGKRLLVVEGSRRLAAIDTGRFTTLRHRARARPVEGSSSGVPMVALAVLAIALVAAGAAGIRRRAG
jgi:hypothetical protein